MDAGLRLHRRIEFKSRWSAAPGLALQGADPALELRSGTAEARQEFAEIQVESVTDQTDAAKEAGPVEAQRMWERTAEDNALDHLQKVGLIAPHGRCGQDSADRGQQPDHHQQSSDYS